MLDGGVGSLMGAWGEMWCERGLCIGCLLPGGPVVLMVVTVTGRALVAAVSSSAVLGFEP